MQSRVSRASHRNPYIEILAGWARSCAGGQSMPPESMPGRFKRNSINHYYDRYRHIAGFSNAGGGVDLA